MTFDNFIGVYNVEIHKSPLSVLVYRWLKEHVPQPAFARKAGFFMLPKKSVGNLFLFAKNVLAVYRLPSLPYEYQAESVQMSIYQQMAIFVQQYKGAGQIIALTRPVSEREVEDALLRYSKHPYWHQHVQAVKQHIGSTTTQDRYLLLPVPRVDSAFQEGKKVLTSWRRKEPEIDSVERWQRAENGIFDRLRAWIPGITKATVTQMERILRAPYYRGITDMPVTWDATTKVATGDDLLSFPVEHDIANAVVWEDPYRLRIEHSDQRVSYQALYGVSHAAKTVEALGDEWIYAPIEKTGIPLDVIVHFTIHSVSASRSKAEKQRAIAKNQYEEYAKTGDVPQQMVDTVVEAEELVNQISRGVPLMDMHVFFALGASSEREIKQFEDHFRGQMDSWFRLVRPPGETLKMWQATFPTETFQGVEKTWRIPCSPDYLASSGVLATGILGDPSGVLLGRLDNGKPVFVNPFRPMMELNQTGTWALIGGLGSGKSVLMKNVTDIALQWGAVGMVISPKLDEYDGVLSRWDRNALHLRFGSDSLAFNPFLLGQDAKESMQIVQGFLSTLLYVTTQRQDQYVSLVLGSALRKLYQGKSISMDGFLAVLQEEEKNLTTQEEKKSAYLIRRRLEDYREESLGRTLFGQSNEALTKWPALTVASIYGLDFPPSTLPPSEWSPDQRFGSAMIYLIAQLGFRRLLTLPPSQPKFLAVDEAWILRGIPEGRALLNTMNLMGRSMNLLLMVAVQNPDVLLSQGESQNDDFSAQLGWIFVGKLDSQQQIRHALRLLHLPEDEEEIQRQFSAFSSGRGFMRDPLGRVGVMETRVFPLPLLQDSFGTTPGKAL